MKRTQGGGEIAYIMKYVIKTAKTDICAGGNEGGKAFLWKENRA